MTLRIEERMGKYRPASIVLTVVLMAVAAVPAVLLSCAGDFRTEAKPIERLTFDSQPKVRVALAMGTREWAALPVKVSDGYTIIDPTTMTPLVRGPVLPASPVVALSDGVHIKIPGKTGTTKLRRIRIVPTKPGTLHVGGRRYRGVLDIICDANATMTLVNEVDLEDYIGGVVAAEMQYWWPREALRAQAVVSRTYTLAIVMENDRKTPRPDWDLSQSYLTAQVYQGVMAEQPRALEAVHSTRGLVLTHNGKVFRTYFSSCCGGHTEACGLVWDDYATIPPLTGKPCKYCTHSKWSDWQRTVTFLEMEKGLKSIGRDVGAVHELAFEDTNQDSHVDRVTVKGRRGTLTVSGNDFRLSVGSTHLYSMNFEAQRTDIGYVFTGHGWGHGVGMCQWGAKGMADVLLDYKRIVEYYYPETELWKVY